MFSLLLVTLALAEAPAPPAAPPAPVAVDAPVAAPETLAVPGSEVVPPPAPVVAAPPVVPAPPAEIVVPKTDAEAVAQVEESFSLLMAGSWLAGLGLLAGVLFYGYKKFASKKPPATP